MLAIQYKAAQSLDEAVTLLATTAGARALAGGHTLLLEPTRSQLGAATLVDLGKIQGLNDIGFTRTGALRIGAMTTIAALADNADIQRDLPALAEAASQVGDPQVRNWATLGGSLADNDPESDLTAVLLALDAQLHLQGPNGTRAVAADQFITGPRQTALTQGELITDVRIPIVGGGSAYEKFKHPATLYALCGVAAHVSLIDGKVGACRVAVTGATEYATRLTGVEAALAGQEPTAEAIAAASEAASGLAFRGDPFGSPEYRAHLTRVLVQRAVTRAVERAR
ncbi:MAG: xanthine dehydrogenase family protein subunit M [Anaerolineae bacterium]|nr:xanthine dehydrogenase family protein subunit M [Anaerolineae bacterium]